MNPNRQLIAGNAKASMMFVKILEICPPHFKIESYRRLPRTCSTIMQSLSVRIEHHPPSCFAETMAPVDVFSVHKELLIEAAHLPKRHARNHPEPARQHLHIVNCIVRIARHLEAAKQFRTRKDPVQPQCATKSVPS